MNGVRKLIVALCALGLLGAPALPVQAHVQEKEDADDSDSFLDVEKTAFWHEKGRFFFLIKTYEPWTKKDFEEQHFIRVGMDSYGSGGEIDYAIFVERLFPEKSESSAPLGPTPEGEVVARLGDYSIEDYLGTVKMQRPNQRKTIFSFNKDRIKVRKRFLGWSVMARDNFFAKTATLGEDPCSSGCVDHVPDDEEKWFRHRF